jgi:hypothetical protein
MNEAPYEKNWEKICDNIEKMDVEALRLIVRQITCTVFLDGNIEHEISSDDVGEICNYIIEAGITVDCEEYAMRTPAEIGES